MGVQTDDESHSKGRGRPTNVVSAFTSMRPTLNFLRGAGDHHRILGRSVGVTGTRGVLKQPALSSAQRGLLIPKPNFFSQESSLRDTVNTNLMLR